MELDSTYFSEVEQMLRAIALTDHVPLITAWSNDTHFEHIFAEQLANLLEPGDVVIGISASGNSPNVITAYVLAPGQNIEQEEDAHLILAHIITRHMREVLRSYGSTLAMAGAN